MYIHWRYVVVIVTAPRRKVTLVRSVLFTPSRTCTLFARNDRLIRTVRTRLDAVQQCPELHHLHGRYRWITARFQPFQKFFAMLNGLTGSAIATAQLRFVR